MRLLERLRERLPPAARERAVVSLVAILVGVGSGLGVAAFRSLIHLVDHVAMQEVLPTLAPWGAWTSALVPIAGGLLVGLLVAFVIGHERHHGVAGIIEAVAVDGGRLRYKRAPAKAVGAALALGTGASVGPEDPSVQIGANLGSFLGQRFGLPEERVRVLVAAGAAAGIAAAFGAPMAGVFFALEVVLGDFAGRGVGLVLVCAVLAAFTCGTVSGGVHTLHAPKYALQSGWEIPFHLVLGMFIGPFAAMYVRSIDGARGYFERSRRALWLRPVLAGAAVGLVAIWLPQLRAVNYGAVESVLAGGSVFTGDGLLAGADRVVLALLLLGVLKLLLTSLCIGAGFPGGVFAPALFIGCMLGGAYGAGASLLFPGMGLRPGAFAMAGMAAFLAASVHAPLTAILIVWEITGDYGTVAAAMAAVALSMIAARIFEPESVYSRALVRKGFRRRALSPLETERVVAEAGAHCVGRAVGEVTWPPGCVVARIRRGPESFTARPETILEPGDEVVAVVDAEARAPFLALCRAPTGP